MPLLSRARLDLKTSSCVVLETMICCISDISFSRDFSSDFLFRVSASNASWLLLHKGCSLNTFSISTYPIPAEPVPIEAVPVGELDEPDPSSGIFTATALTARNMQAEISVIANERFILEYIPYSEIELAGVFAGIVVKSISPIKA